MSQISIFAVIITEELKTIMKMTALSARTIKVFFDLMCAVSCLAAYAGDDLKVYDVTLSRPGTLRQTVGTDSPAGVLRISGALNNDDVRWLRSVCGGDSVFVPHPSVVKVLDLRKAEFAPDPSARPLANHATMTIRSRHALPIGFLYACTLDSLMLPERLDSVNMWSLWGTGLREIEIPEGVYVHNMAIGMSESLERLRLPEFAMTDGQGCPRLKSIFIGTADYVPSGSFNSFPALEEVIFTGSIGHIDGYQFRDCPELRRVEFRGPVASMGGPGMFNNCPKLEAVEFQGLVSDFGLEAPTGSPDFRGYALRHGAMISNPEAKVPQADEENPQVKAEAEAIFDSYKRWLSGENDQKFLVKVALAQYKDLASKVAALGVDTAPVAEAARPYLNNDFFKGTPKLEVLKKSAPYKAQSEPLPVFRYAPASDSLLALSRERFNLDSIAGEGSDFERMKRLNYWIHDLIPHDGSSLNPSCAYNIRDIYDLCQKEDRGVNCRILAIMLTEALLAEGIPARYLTCEPEAYMWDSDCHVIVAAWSSDFSKWVWLDPTHASFVTDENGVPLHPGEVRERLIADLPLVLNEDANWNHRKKTEVDGYLKNYMAKNLYCITARVVNCSQPEGREAQGNGSYVALVPEGFRLGEEWFIYTSDPERFWAPPQGK